MARCVMAWAVCAVTVFASGCGTLNGAQPLDEGQHAVGLTFGGPIVTALGPPIPLPNLVVEGRSGMAPVSDMAFDLNYGLNLTAAAFGLMGIHFGGSLLVMEGAGWTPSISVTDRAFLNHNYFDTTKAVETRGLSVVNQLEVTFGWQLGHHLLYGGLTDYFDFGSPGVLIGPFLGTELRPGGDAFHMQVELRHMGATFAPEVSDVEFLTPGVGVLAFTFSVGWTLGQAGEDTK